MKLRSSKAACYVGAAIIFFAVPVLPAVATTYEKPQNTDTGIKVASYSANTEEVLVTGYEQTGTYKNKAVALTDPYLDVYGGTDEESSDVVGRLYANTLVDVDMVGKEWTKISSGNCEGYVLTQNLCFGDEAEVLAEKNKAKEELRKEISSLAVQGAEKIISKTLDKKTSQSLVDEAIDRL